MVFLLYFIGLLQSIEFVWILDFKSTLLLLSAIIPVANGSNISGGTLYSSYAQSKFLKD